VDSPQFFAMKLWYVENLGFSFYLGNAGLYQGVDFDFELDDFFFQSLVGQAAGSLFLTGTFNEDSFNLALDALAGTSYAKILAEPNLVVLSGQTASFLSGGEFAVPTVVGVGGAQAATTTFNGFGTFVNFTPTVLDKDRIRLIVKSTFSTLNPENSVQGIPGLNTRTVNTVVELREGQVLAIAGLLQEQQRGNETRVPLLGDIKWLKPLFQTKGISRDETELIILVSPELVHPVEPENAPAILPGMEVTEPDDIEFFLLGRIEGDPCCHHRSTVWPLYRDRMQKKCAWLSHGRKYENSRPSNAYYLNGPHGFSE
jgi:pilus assembly protein CpaC